MFTNSEVRMSRRRNVSLTEASCMLIEWKKYLWEIGSRCHLKPSFCYRRISLTIEDQGTEDSEMHSLRITSYWTTLNKFICSMECKYKCTGVFIFSSHVLWILVIRDLLLLQLINACKMNLPHDFVVYVRGKAHLQGALLELVVHFIPLRSGP